MKIICVFDPLEGSFPRKSIEAGRTKQKSVLNESEFKKGLPSQIYINCWHANAMESAAMCLIANKPSPSRRAPSVFITLSPTTATLVTCSISISYRRKFRTQNYVIAPFSYKRKFFEHEREVRILSLSGAGEREAVKIDLADLLLEMYVQPESLGWYGDIVRNLLGCCGFDFPVKQ